MPTFLLVISFRLIIISLTCPPNWNYKNKPIERGLKLKLEPKITTERIEEILKITIL